VEHCKKTDVTFEDLIPNFALRKAVNWFSRQRSIGAKPSELTVKRAAPGEENNEPLISSKSLLEEAKVEATEKVEKGLRMKEEEALQKLDQINY